MGYKWAQRKVLDRAVRRSEQQNNIKESFTEQTKQSPCQQMGGRNEVATARHGLLRPERSEGEPGRRYALFQKRWCIERTHELRRDNRPRRSFPAGECGFPFPRVTKQPVCLSCRSSSQQPRPAGNGPQNTTQDYHPSERFSLGTTRGLSVEVIKLVHDQ